LKLSWDPAQLRHMPRLFLQRGVCRPNLEAPNIHPSPEMLADDAQPSRRVVDELGWYDADTSCPIRRRTWPAAIAACTIAAAETAAQGGMAYAA